MRTASLAVVIGLCALGFPASATQLPVGATALPFEPDLRMIPAFTGQYCRATPGDGGLIVATVTRGTPCMFMPDPTLMPTASYRVEAAARLRQGPDNEHFGIFIGDRSDTKRGSYLTVTYTANGVAALEYLDDNKWNRISPVTPAAKPRMGLGAINRVAVEVRGKEIRAFLNGELFATGVSVVPVDGRTGLYVDEIGQEIVFTEFRVTSLAPTTTFTNPAATSDTRMTAGGTVFLEDDLSTTPRFALIQDEFCTTAYADGGLRITGVGVNGCEWYPGRLNEAPMRARFELSARTIKGDTSGLIFGYGTRADKLHYHFMTSATGQFVLELSQNGTSRALIPWTKSSSVRATPGATNRLAVEVHLQELRCFINGQYVGRATSPEVVQGDYGFIVLGTGNVVVFSNLKITDLSGGTNVSKEGAGAKSLAVATRTSSGQSPESRGGESRGRPKGQR